MATFKQYEKKDGSKAWEFQAYLGVNQMTGKPVKTTRRGFSTKKEAQLVLNRLLVDFENEGLKKVNATTFKEVYHLWLEHYKGTVKESTRLGTERYINLHVLPLIGDYKIDKIDMKTAQKAVNAWADKLQVYKYVLQYVVKIMDYAISLEMIEKNPFERVVRPKVKMKRKDKEFQFYTTEQINQVLSYLENKVKSVKDSNLLYKYFAEWDYAMYRLLAFTGLRGSEALALTFDDIDFTCKTLRVNKTLSKTKEGYEVSTPKTKSSNRVISLDDKTVMILKKWQLRQKEMYFANRTKNNNIIFADLKGKHSNRQALYLRSNRIADFVGLPHISTHGWRHSHASMLYEAGVPMKEAQDRLGHSSIEMTSSIYTHLSEKQKNAVVDKLTKFASF